MGYKRLVILFFISISLIIACGDDSPTGSNQETGAIEVSTQTSGDDVDSDGYIITAGNQNTQIGASSSTVISGLAEGTYQLELSEISSNCDTENNNPKNVSVFAEDTTSVSFKIACLEQANNKIVFHSNRDGDFEIYTINPDGSQISQLTNNNDKDKFPVFSKNGTKISYISDQGGSTSLKVMDVDGSNKQTLTTATFSTYGRYPLSSWSGDSEQIIFARDGIRKIDSDGGNETLLSEHRGRSPSWSHDGNLIAYIDYIYPTLVIMDSNGSIKDTLAGNGMQPDTTNVPKWSPDDNTLVASNQINGQNELFLINSDGSNFRMLTNEPSSDETFPSWSPDGNRVVFQSDIYGDEIFIMTVDTNNDQFDWERITINSTDVVDGAPHWSPVE